jgi:hypothetical protein
VKQEHGKNRKAGTYNWNQVYWNKIKQSAKNGSQRVPDLEKRIKHKECKATRKEFDKNKRWGLSREHQL